MTRKGCLWIACLVATSTVADAQVGMPGIEYSGGIAAFEGGQLYPFDRQDPWLHGYFQRVPAYGGFARFRPYNYRHVFAQTQLSAAWGMPHGMPYSQQFWNRYRGDYLNEHLHSQAAVDAHQASGMSGAASVSHAAIAAGRSAAPATHAPGIQQHFAPRGPRTQPAPSLTSGSYGRPTPGQSPYYTISHGRGEGRMNASGALPAADSGMLPGAGVSRSVGTATATPAAVSGRTMPQDLPQRPIHVLPPR